MRRVRRSQHQARRAAFGVRQAADVAGRRRLGFHSTSVTPASTLARVFGYSIPLPPFDPSTKRYRHNLTGEDNGDAHHKRQIMGREVVVAVTGGKMDFGPWEQVFYGEVDGRRSKRVLVKVIGE